MKARSSLLLACLLCVAFAAPAFAQGNKAQHQLQGILRRHPKLAANPSLAHNPQWLAKNPEVHTWFQQHPHEWNQTKKMGAWESNGTWRSSNWWFQNNPNWVYQNQRGWIQHNPQWREHGDWDNGKWHSRDWYMKNNPGWVKHHRPHWLSEAQPGGPPYGKAKGHYKEGHHEQGRHDHHSDQH